MLLILNIFIFIFGLVIGSFLNSVMYRLEKGEKPNGRSYCPHCKHTLAWKDLIPVFSFLLLKGKCRYCHKKISFQYPIVELTTGFIFLIIFNYQLSHIEFSIFYFLISIFSWYIASSLLVIFIYDIRNYIIPDAVLLPAIAVTFLYQFFAHNSLFVNYLLAAAIAFFFFWVIFFISRGAWMGFGDVKLVVLLGLILGFPHILLGLFLAFLFGAVIGLGMMVISIFDKKGMIAILKNKIPFAPFLIMGTLVTIVFGQDIINWYVSLLI